ncbi:MAG TPA: PLD nuclease N-terminal domain-containing protein, partial [Acidimicrobiales bacterium]|nr:PLD nuclease N-terminal domain-containing protein [Acidimicrobiales bacterium]
MRNYKRKRKVRWGDLPAWQRAGMVVLGAVEVSLAGAAWADLIRRPSSQVRGPKWRWALVIGVNIFGPLSYFCWGRIQPGGPGGSIASADSSRDIDI